MRLKVFCGLVLMVGVVTDGESWVFVRFASSSTVTYVLERDMKKVSEMVKEFLVDVST